MSNTEFRPSESEFIPRHFKDMRNYRTVFPTNIEDKIIERDIALALLSEIKSDGRKAIPTAYWGIILPEDIHLIDLSKHRTHCPNCVNAVYTNLWTYSEEAFNFVKKWQNIFILSPNITYPQPFNDFLDCQTGSCKRYSSLNHS